MEKLKCCVVGDGGVGKTSMLITYAGKVMQDCHVTVFDHHVVNIKVDDKLIEAELLETAGQEDYERFRPLSYPGTDVFLFCFAINNRNSFENIKSKWIPEVLHYTSTGLFLLVGTKSDIRTWKKSEDLLSLDEGLVMAKDVGALRYLECSAKTEVGLNKAFEEAGRAVVTAREKKIREKTKKKLCIIL